MVTHPGTAAGYLRLNFSMRTTYTCHNVEAHPQDGKGIGHPHEFAVMLYSAQPGDRINPPTPAECEPDECPVCGFPVDIEDLTERLASEHEAAAEDAAEARMEA